MRTVAYAYSDPLLDAPTLDIDWGQPVDQVYFDIGDRQQLDQLLADAVAQPPDYLLVRRLDELGDSLEQVSERLFELEALGVQWVAIETPLASKHSTQAELLQLFRAIQLRQKSRRIQQGHARNRINALPPPGKAPYGYRRGKDRYLLDRSTAPVVKDFFEHFLLYGSLRGSVRYLQRKYSKKISVSTGKRWLTSPVYRGDLVYRQGETISDTHTPIISPQEAAQVDRLLRRNRQLPPRTASAPRSLAGLITCASCQSSMTITKVTAPHKAQEYLYLRPVACPNQPTCKAIPYTQLLEETIQRICADLPKAVADLESPDMEGIKQGLTAQIAAKQQVLEQLPNLVDSGVLDQDTANLRAYTVRVEIAKLRSQLAQLPPVNLKALVQAVAIPQFWRDLSEAERRFYFREFIRQIHLVRDEDGWHLQLMFIF